MRELHAWMEGRPVGTFIENADGEVAFRYHADAPDYPISLSLPRDGSCSRHAPGRFLDNLLPERQSMRTTMMRATGASGTDSFSLLDGADASGGLVFSCEDARPDEIPEIVLATMDDIRARIETLQHAPESWWANNPHARFSLAGEQPKFTLSRIEGGWAWPNAANPSTHILKPELSRAPGSIAVEAASMQLARMTGENAAASGILDFEGERVYATERFDRAENEDGRIVRVHAEDMLQALGMKTSDKYHVKAKDVLRTLHAADPSDTLSYAWVGQLALNVSIGNVDAHAKNYSILLRPSGISLAPMYDVLTTTYWPYVSRELPMRIGGATGAAQTTPHHWRRLAEDNGLDPDRMEEIARTTAGRVLSHAAQAYAGLPEVMRDALMTDLRKANLRVEPIFSDLA